MQIPAPLQPLHRHQYCVSFQAACSSHSGQAVHGSSWTREPSSQVPAKLTNKVQHDAMLQQLINISTGSEQVDCKLDVYNLACDKSNWMGNDKVIEDAISRRRLIYTPGAVPAHDTWKLRAFARRILFIRSLQVCGDAVHVQGALSVCKCCLHERPRANTGQNLSTNSTTDQATSSIAAATWKL